MSYKFSFTPSIVRYLQSMERVREVVRLTILPLVVAERLRLQAYIRSTHYSTRIEGNRLTLSETEQVIQQGSLFPGRERDVKEVKRYYQALQQMEKWVESKQKITEKRIQKLHAMIYSGGGRNQLLIVMARMSFVMLVAKSSTCRLKQRMFPV